MELFSFLGVGERLSFLCSCEEAYDWCDSKKEDKSLYSTLNVSTNFLSKNPEASHVAKILENRNVERLPVTVDCLGRIQGQMTFCGNLFSWKDGMLHGKFVSKEDKGKLWMYLFVQSGIYENGVRKNSASGFERLNPTYNF